MENKRKIEGLPRESKGQRRSPTWIKKKEFKGQRRSPTWTDLLNDATEVRLQGLINLLQLRGNVRQLEQRTGDTGLTQ